VALRVHSWGGLGSQMFALSLIFEIRKEYPRRRIKVIHHTSGLSRRLFEIEFMLDNKTQLMTTDDYVKPTNLKNFKSDKPKKLVLKAAKSILNFFALSVDFDSNNSLKRIKRWTYEVRGHYSKSLVSENFLKHCVSFYKVDNTEKIRMQNSLVIHYRLGDLIDLPGRSNIKFNEILQVVHNTLKTNNFERIIIYSDSVDIAKEMLTSLEDLMIPIDYSDLPTISLVTHSVNAKFFIGTNSKVSIWIVTIREYLKLKSALLNN
jgi:hypothetical protein